MITCQIAFSSGDQEVEGISHEIENGGRGKGLDRERGRERENGRKGKTKRIRNRAKEFTTE